MFELLIGQGLLQKSEAGVGDRETTIELSAGNIDIQRLSGKIRVSWDSQLDFDPIY